MILALDTSTPVCMVYARVNDTWQEHSWESGRGLAKGLLEYIQKVLSEYDETLSTLDALIVFKGPGSFTGLRIGLTVANTIADAQSIPIIGSNGDKWVHDGLSSFLAGENDLLVMPDYGSEPHITTPRK